MSSSVFERLGFNAALTGNLVIELSSDAIAFLNTMPPMLSSSWQKEDVATDNVGDYLTNPVGTDASSMVSSIRTIVTICTDVTGLESVLAAATSCNTAATEYYDHTQRISGQVKPDVDTSDKPHFENAVSVGRSLIYLTYQTDGITNTAPIVGSFGSVLIGDTITEYANTISSFIPIIQNSITQDLMLLTYSSSLGSTTQNEMIAYMNGVSSNLTAYRTGDETFYENSKAVLLDVAEVNEYTMMGEAKTDLVTNYFGSNKLLTRLASANT